MERPAPLPLSLVTSCMQAEALALLLSGLSSEHRVNQSRQPESVATSPSMVLIHPPASTWEKKNEVLQVGIILLIKAKIPVSEGKVFSVAEETE